MKCFSDSLRLRAETLAMAYTYTHKYAYHVRAHAGADLLDAHTLALASLSLATKATESPRRLREFLVPAHSLLHAPPAPALTFPSARYDALRATLVAAELLLLRVLRFDIRLPLAFDYLPRMLERALAAEGTDHFDNLRDDERAEIAVVDPADTALGRAVWERAADAACSYRLVNLFPARTVAVACVFVVLEERGVEAVGDPEVWVKKLTGGRVEFGDFEEAVVEVRELRR